MLENAHLFDLFYFHPRAFLLLNYLKLISQERKSISFFFWAKNLHTVSSRVILTKDQVKRNLKILEKSRFIKIEKCKHPRHVLEITLTPIGEFYV